MSITPLVGSSGPNAAGIVSAELPGHADSGQADKTATATERPAPPAGPDEAALKALNEWSSDRGLEVRFETLPDSKATVLRVIDSKTGHVLNEFPPEGVAIALAELRAKADKQALDHRA